VEFGGAECGVSVVFGAVAECDGTVGWADEGDVDFFFSFDDFFSVVAGLGTTG